jgi:hypothetical protein
MTPSSPPPNRAAARPPRAAEAGIGRPGGLFVAALIAAAVFGIGQRLFPRHQVETPPAAPPPAPPPPSTPPPTIGDAAAPLPTDALRTTTTSADAANHDAHAEQADRDALAARPEVARPSAEDAGEAAPTGPADRKPAGDREERPADKDLARAAWRRNRPDVSSDGDKSSILIPLKGSIAGAGFRVTNRPHAVIVTLPKAASLITMRLYRVSRDGFGLLWINQAEKDPDPTDGTSLKIGLSDLGDPLVEIKDDFVRVTVHRPNAEAPAPAHPPAREHPSAPERAPAAAVKAPSTERPPASEHKPATEHTPGPEHAPAPKAPPPSNETTD